MNQKTKKWLLGLFFFSLPLIIQFVSDRFQIEYSGTLLAFCLSTLAAYVKQYPIRYEDDERINPSHLPLKESEE